MKISLKPDLLLMLFLTEIWKSYGASFASSKIPLSASKLSISPSRNTAFVNQPRHSASSNVFTQEHCNRMNNENKMNLQAGMLLDLTSNFDALASSDLILAAQSGVLGAATSFHKMMQAGQFLFDSASTYVSIYMLNAVVADHTNRKILPQVDDLVPTKLPFLNDAHQSSKNVILEFDDDLFQNSLYVDEPHEFKASTESLNHSRRMNRSIPDLPDPDDEEDDTDDTKLEVENRKVIEIEEEIVVLEDPTTSNAVDNDIEVFDLPLNSNDENLSVTVQDFKRLESEDESELAKLQEKTHRALLEERLLLEEKSRQIESTLRNTHEVEVSDTTANERSIWDEDFEIEESEPIVVEDVFIRDESHFSPDECEFLNQNFPTDTHLIADINDGSITTGDSEHEATKSDTDLFFADEVYPDLPMAQGLCDAAFQAERNRVNTRKRDEYVEKLEHDMAELRQHIVQKGVESEISRRRQLAHAEASKLLKKYVEEENENRHVSKSSITEEVSLIENGANMNDVLEDDDEDMDDTEYELEDSYSKLFSPKSKRDNSKRANGRLKRMKRVSRAALELVLPISSFARVRKVGKVSSDALESIFPVKTEDVLDLAKKREIVLTSVAIVFARRLLRIWVGPLFPF